MAGLDTTKIRFDSTQVYKYKYANTYIPIFVTPYDGVIDDTSIYQNIPEELIGESALNSFQSTALEFGLVSISGYISDDTFQYSDGTFTLSSRVDDGTYYIQHITIDTGSLKQETSIYVRKYTVTPLAGEIAGCFSMYLLEDTNGRLIGDDFLTATNCISYIITDPLKQNFTIEGLENNNKGKISGSFDHVECRPRQYRTNSNKDLMNMWSDFYRSIVGKSKLYDSEDPYEAGEEQDNPGDGEFDYTGDLVEVPDLPEVKVTDSGFVRLFAPTEKELEALANFMWSDAFSLDTFKKLFADPMDCILGLSIVPVNLPTGGKESITVGNIVTTVSCTKCSSQYVKIKCGSFTFSTKKLTGSYLDYSPYLKCYLYLPYIGTQQIDVDEFMGATMSIEYHVDILTGAMFCYVSTTKGLPKGNKLVYTFAGQCAENVPLSSTSYGNTIASILQAASSIGAVAATAATGGAAAPVAAGLLASATTSTANAATSMKPNIQHSGSVAGGAGIMGVRYPYLIFEAPWLVPVSGQEKYTGFASGKVVKLSSLSGFATIEAINLSVKGATDEELREIKRVLQEGVIL